MSVQIVNGVAHLSDEVNAFAASIEMPADRWRYAARAGSHKFYAEWRGHGEWREGVNAKAIPALSRLLGVSPWMVKSRVGRIVRDGFDNALSYAIDYDAQFTSGIMKPYLFVGAMPPWCCGHVYFARVATHPHVLKIGFSRRVRDRLEDIASKCKCNLVVRAGHLKVGTQADEYWWHTNWAKHRIDGEWFFDPRSTDRSLPAFLQMQEAA